MFIIGLLAGWTNENTSVGLIVILLSTLIIDKITTKKWNLTKTKVAGIIGSLIGFILMICAPGNYVRNAEFKDDTFIIVKFSINIYLHITYFYYLCTEIIIKYYTWIY